MNSTLHARIIKPSNRNELETENSAVLESEMSDAFLILGYDTRGRTVKPEWAEGKIPC